jgi:hypothetical protein
MVIAAAQVVEGNANLKDSLIEPTHITPLSPPEQFERLVLLEVLAAIELRNPLEQLGRWQLITGRHHDSRMIAR